MEHVIYREEKYEIFHKYNSGYYEIRKVKGHIQEVTLVHYTEIKPIKDSA